MADSETGAEKVQDEPESKEVLKKQWGLIKRTGANFKGLSLATSGTIWVSK